LRARICAQRGRLAQAEALWKQALTFDPTNPDYMASLDYIYDQQKPPSVFNLLRKWLLPMLLILLAFILVAGLTARLAGLQNAVDYNAGLLTDLPKQLTQPTQTLPTPLVINVPTSVSPADLESLKQDLSTKIEAGNQAQSQLLENLNNLQTSQDAFLDELRATPQLPQLNLSLQGVQVTPVDGSLQVSFERGLFLFETYLSAEGLKMLTQLGQQLEPQANAIHITIIGFHDDTERDGYFSIGLLRALRVYDHLLASTQLAGSAFTLQPQGERPAPYPNDLPENRARNRTVMLIITVR
jgi:flagellar motor protein MotB